MRTPLKHWLLGIALAAAMPAVADLVVVVNPKANIDRLDRSHVINIFLGRFRQLPGGELALPVDLPANDPDRDAFYRKLVNKEPAEIASYWSRLVFSGGTQPPRTSRNSDEALRFVAGNPGAIAYVERARADARVKIVFELGD